MGQLLHKSAACAKDDENNIIPNAKLYVYRAGTDQLSPIFEDPGLTIMLANPVIANENGEFACSYLVDGEYRLVTGDARGNPVRETESVRVQTATISGFVKSFPSVADLISDQSLRYSAGAEGLPISENQLVQISDANISYRVASEEATDHHLTTQGGVKLYTIPMWSGNEGGIHNPIAWGAALDGVTDDSLVFQRIVDCGGSIFLPGGICVFGNQAIIQISKPLRIIGHGAELKDMEFKASSAADTVTFEGVRFSTSLTGGDNPPYAINTRNLDFVTLKDCRFLQVMVYIATDDNNLHAGVTVERCRFHADWSNWVGSSLQTDLLTVSGYQHVVISQNYMDAVNINRFIKLTVGLTVPLSPAADPVPEYRSKGIFITRNTILGTSAPGSGKQIVDCFSGTTQLVFSQNYVVAKGFSSGVENKTGFSYVDGPITNSTKISENYFEVDECAVNYQGSFGATGWTSNCYDELLVIGNTFRKASVDGSTSAMRFLSELKIQSNSFVCDDGITTDHHIQASSCENQIISGNRLRNGSVIISKATSNASGNGFDSQARNIVFEGNVISDYHADAAIMVKDCSDLESVVLTGNVAETTFEDAGVKAAYWLRASHIERAVVTGNTANHSSASAKNKLVCTYSTIHSLSEYGNSWHPAPKTLANDGTPSLKSVSSGSSIAGGDVWKTGGTVDITDFDDGKPGQTITVCSAHDLSIKNGTSIKLAGGTDFAMTPGDTLTLAQFASGVWSELSRTVV